MSTSPEISADFNALALKLFQFQYQYVLPDREKMRISVLSPGDDVNQNSSLSRYLSRAFKELGSEGSQLFFHQETGLDMPGLVTALKQSAAEQEPVLENEIEEVLFE